jgi:hypothetical protein
MLVLRLCSVRMLLSSPSSLLVARLGVVQDAFGMLLSSFLLPVSPSCSTCQNAKGRKEARAFFRTLRVLFLALPSSACRHVLLLFF